MLNGPSNEGLFLLVFTGTYTSWPNWYRHLVLFCKKGVTFIRYIRFNMQDRKEKGRETVEGEPAGKAG